MRVVEELNATLHALMEADAGLHVVGEDILDPYGGAFKVTKGLSSKYPGRVLSTPISEAGLVGFSLGLSLRGKPVIAEIMFGDFVTLAMDQLVNHAAKMRWMSNDIVSAPLVVRAPMGGGRGYGPTHSQSLEKHFCGVPGLTVLAANAYLSPGALLRRAYELCSPVLFIENKVMYSKLCGAVQTSSGSRADVTLVTYGGGAEICVRAAERLHRTEEIATKIVLIEQLSPFDRQTVVEGVGGSDYVLTVEEGTEGWGFGSECARALLEVGSSPRHFRSVAASPTPIPSARNLEAAALPCEQTIIDAVVALLSS